MDDSERHRDLLQQQDTSQRTRRHRNRVRWQIVAVQWKEAAMRFMCSICGEEITDEEALTSYHLQTALARRAAISGVHAHARCWPAWAQEYVPPHPAPVSLSVCAGCQTAITAAEEPFCVFRQLSRGEDAAQVLEALRVHDRCWPAWARAYARPYRPPRPRLQLRFEQLDMARGLELLRAQTQQLAQEGFDQGLLDHLYADGEGPIMLLPPPAPPRELGRERGPAVPASTPMATVIAVDRTWGPVPPEARDVFPAMREALLRFRQTARQQYPSDTLEIVGFAPYAQPIADATLAALTEQEQVLGCNWEAALQLAEQLLAAYPGHRRHILLIVRDEPTAHLERGRSYFAYPPSPPTIRVTLAAARACQAAGIALTLLMLRHTVYIQQFVEEVAREAGARVLFTSPERLAADLLEEYRHPGPTAEFAG